MKRPLEVGDRGKCVGTWWSNYNDDYVRIAETGVYIVREVSPDKVLVEDPLGNTYFAHPYQFRRLVKRPKVKLGRTWFVALGNGGKAISIYEHDEDGIPSLAIEVREVLKGD